MDSETAVIGALIFIALIIGANFVMYAIARGAARNTGSSWMSALKQGLSKPLDSQSSKSMDELHQKVSDLQKKNQEKEE